jgi:hypothetical protein
MLFHKIQGAAGTVNAGFKLSNFSYDGISFDVSTRVADARGIVVKSDGTRIICSSDDNNLFSSYDLSSGWDLSTISDPGWTRSISTNNPRGLFIRPDGSKVFGVDNASNAIEQYSLSTSWDIRTASYLGEFSTNTEDGTPRGITFDDTGTNMYVTGTDNNFVYYYTLGTAWDVSTASYVGTVLSLRSTSIQFSSDGLRFLSTSDNSIISYTLSTAWDITTATLDDNSLDVSGQCDSLRSFYMSPDSDVIFVLDEGLSARVIYSYSI